MDPASSHSHLHHIIITFQALFFDRYQKLLAPGSDPLRDTRLRDYLNAEMGMPRSTSGGGMNMEMEGSVDTVIVSSTSDALVNSSSTVDSSSDWIIDSNILQ